MNTERYNLAQGRIATNAYAMAGVLESALERDIFPPALCVFVRSLLAAHNEAVADSKAARLEPAPAVRVAA